MSNTEQAIEIMAGLIDKPMAMEGYWKLMSAIAYLNSFGAWIKDEDGDESFVFFR